MIGEEGLRQVFVFSLLRVIFGLAAEVSLGVLLGRIFFIKREDELVSASEKNESNYIAEKRKGKIFKIAARISGFVFTYAFLIAAYMSLNIRIGAFYMQSIKNDFSYAANISYISFIKATYKDINDGVTITDNRGRCRISIEKMTLGSSKPGYIHSAKKWKIFYKFICLEDDDRYTPLVAQVSRKDGEKLKKEIDPELEYNVQLYKNSGLIASIEPAVRDEQE